MDYKKIRKDNYTLHLINTDRFKEINVSVRFTKKYDKKTSCYLKLLERVLLNNGTKTKSRKDISKELENLYRSDIGTKYSMVSKNMFFDIRLSFINPKYTNIDMYKQTFNLFKDIIYNQKITNNKFNDETFEIEKKNLITSILSIKDEPTLYSRIKFEEEFYKNTIYEENNYKNIKLFENLKNEELYNVYKDLFNNYKIDVLVIGNIIDNENTLIDLIDDLLKGFKENIDIEKNLYFKLDKKEESTNISEFNSNQSALYLGFTLIDITNVERDFVLALYNAILGAMNNSLLFVKVREENSLCYHIGSNINRYSDTLVVSSLISKENYEKCLKLIKECMNMMCNEKTIDKLITNAKKTLNLAYNDYYDNINKIIEYYYINEISYIPSMEQRREYINNITIDKVVELAKKVKLKEVYLLKGVLTNEKD